MTWLQLRPLSRRLPALSLLGVPGNIVIGSRRVNVLPTFVDRDAYVLQVVRTMLPLLAPLGSGGVPPVLPNDVSLPKTTGSQSGAAPSGAGPPSGPEKSSGLKTAMAGDVGAKLSLSGPFGTGGRPLLLKRSSSWPSASISKGGNGASQTLFGGAVDELEFAEPGEGSVTVQGSYTQMGCRSSGGTARE
jgi:hypothetical protein